MKDRIQNRHSIHAKCRHVRASHVQFHLEALESRLLLSTARFTWSMPDRFGLDNNHDGLIDFDNDPSFVNPGVFKVDIDASKSTGTSLTYRLTVTGAALNGKILTGTSMSPKMWFTAPLGTYNVKVEAWSPNKKPSIAQQTIEVKDILYVSMGDSIASGEGCPEIPSPRSPNGRPVWSDSPLAQGRHFGGYQSADAQAALKLERDDPHSSVTFVSVASSGASIADGLLAPQHGARGYTIVPQVQSLQQIVGSRRIDVLRISVGANDIRFSDVVERLVAHDSQFSFEKTYQIGSDVNQRLSVLDQNFNQLARIGNVLNVAPSSIYLTEYPDPVSGTNHDILDDANRGFSGDLVDASLSRDEMNWAEQYVLHPLNNELWNVAARFGWNYVGGIDQAFSGHGYETLNPWIVSYQDAMYLQGLDTGEDNPSGMLHPNYEGQRQIASILYNHIRPSIAVETRSFIEGASTDTLRGITARVQSLPLNILAGSNINIQMALSNDTRSKIQGNVRIDVFLSSTPTGDGTSVFLGRYARGTMKIGAGKTTTLSWSLSVPASAPTGNLYLILRVSPPNSKSPAEVMDLSQLVTVEKNLPISGDVKLRLGQQH